MPAIAEFALQLERRADLLEAAATFDDACCAFQPPNFGGRGEPGRRRHWTRQDRNRLEFEIDASEIEHAQDSAGRNLAAEWDALDARFYGVRMRTRVWGVLAMLRRRRLDIRQYHGAALTEAEQRGIYNTFAALLNEALEAHRLLVAAYDKNDSDWEMEPTPTWPEIEARHKAAVYEINLHLPPAPAKVSEPPHPVHATGGIPPEFRTIAMTKQKAAGYLRSGNPDSAVEWLNQCIADGTIACETFSRQSHVFDSRAFPANAQAQIRPAPRQ